MPATFARPLSPSARKFVPQSCPLPARPIGAANDAKLVPSITAAGGVIAFPIAADGSLFMPFCEVKTARGLVRIDREAGALLAQSSVRIESRGGALTRMMPAIVRGHSDIASYPGFDPSTPALGWITTIETEAAGIRLRADWGEENDPVRNRRYGYFEPYFGLRAVPGGFIPAQLVSVGVTNQPGTIATGAENDHTSRSATLRSIERQKAIAAEMNCFPGLDFTAAFNMAARKNRHLFT